MVDMFTRISAWKAATVETAMGDYWTGGCCAVNRGHFANERFKINDRLKAVRSHSVDRVFLLVVYLPLNSISLYRPNCGDALLLGQ